MIPQGEGFAKETVLRKIVLQAPKQIPTNVTPTSDGPGGRESGHRAALGRTGASDPSGHLGTEPSVQGERDTLKPASSPPGPSLPLSLPSSMRQSCHPGGLGFPGLSGLTGRKGDTKNPEFKNNENKNNLRPF